MIRIVRQTVFVVSTFLSTYIIAVQYFFWETALRIKGWIILEDAKPYYSVQKKTAVVTGGSQGLGFETVRALLSLGAHVIVGSSSRVRAAAAKAQMDKWFKNSEVEFLPLDLKSMSSVRSFCSEILKRNVSVDLLICNAGVMMVPWFETKDGFESHLSINYLGHCLLTDLLMPRLVSAGTSDRTARIVNVSSVVHKAGNINFDDLNGKILYSCYHGYTQSKLAQVMFTQSLARHLRECSLPVSVSCIHPGIVDTDLYREIWWSPLVSGLLFKTPEEGVKTTLYAALSPELEGISGCYLEECAIAQPSFISQDRTLQDRLWNATWSLLKPWCNDTDVYIKAPRRTTK